MSDGVLKPCNVCKGEAVVFKFDGIDSPNRYCLVECDSCGECTNVYDIRDEDAAIAEWNSKLRKGENDE